MAALSNVHPRQRLSSPSRGLSAVLHVVGLASFINSFKFLNDNPNPINSSYGWHFQHLTIIGLLLCTLTFLAGLLSDLTWSRQLFRIKYVLSITAAPMAVLISTLYRTLHFVDATLVVPPELALPLSTDLSFHAAPAFFLLLDILFFSPPWTMPLIPALLLSTVIAFAYWFWIELCFRHNGFYPYPIFGLLNTVQRVGLFGLSAALMTGISGAIGWVWVLVNGIEKPGKQN